MFEFRSLVLVSPLGTRWMGAFRRTTEAPLPRTLPEGLVEDPTPYIRTGIYGARLSPMEEGDETPVREASLALGDAIIRVLERGFVTRAR